MRRFLSGAMVVIAVMMGGCGEKSNATAPASEAPGAPVLPKHFYSLKDGKEYGYEQAVSEEARRQGQGTTSLLMFSYLGRKGDAYQVMLKDGNMRTIAECSRPCEFSKVYTFVGDRFIKKETMRVTPEIVVAAVLADAMNGQLDQMLGEQNGVPVTFWVDGETKRLVVANAATSEVKR